jgi:hypothetical protein
LSLVAKKSPCPWGVPLGPGLSGAAGRLLFAYAAQYTIWLEETQLGKPRLQIWIPGGDTPNSLHFAGRTPQIRDQQGAIMPWMTRNGYAVYCTDRLVTLEGSWQGDYTLQIETIR